VSPHTKPLQRAFRILRHYKRWFCRWRQSFAYLIPCHRVIPQDGLLGEYRWARQERKALLAGRWQNQLANPDSYRINLSMTMGLTLRWYALGLVNARSRHEKV